MSPTHRKKAERLVIRVNTELEQIADIHNPDELERHATLVLIDQSEASQRPHLRIGCIALNGKLWLSQKGIHVPVINQPFEFTPKRTLNIAASPKMTVPAAKVLAVHATVTGDIPVRDYIWQHSELSKEVEQIVEITDGIEDMISEIIAEGYQIV
jgi:hypothetical protein